MSDKMVRKIYSKAIYFREKQNGRKVYQRTNNVLPTNVPDNPDETVDTYEISNVVIKTSGSGYTADTILSINSDKATTAGTVKILTVDESGAVETIEVVSNGSYLEDISGDFSNFGDNVEGAGLVLTVTTTKVEQGA